MKGSNDRKNFEEREVINALLYVRVSTNKQAQKSDGSLDTQTDRLKKFVEYKNSSGKQKWVIAHTLIEGEKEGKRRGASAKDTKRIEFQKMMDLARAGLIDAVVTTEVDRLGRNTIEFLTTVHELDSCGVRVVSLDRDIDMTNPTGRLLVAFSGAISQWEREMIAKRTKEKMQWRAEKGLPTGPPPIGYKMENKMYVIDQEYATHVNACDELYLRLESSDMVLKKFAKKGYRTPRGKLYTKPMICRILRNPTYAGKLVRGEDVFDAQWEPLRTYETHQKIQKILDRNNLRKSNVMRVQREYPYLLQGLIRCGKCQYKMSPRPGKGRGRYYPYYACGNAEKSGGFSCERRYIPAEAADRAVLEYLKQLELKPEVVKSFVEKANDIASETVSKLLEDLERGRAQLSIVRVKIANIVDAIADQGKSAITTLGKKLESLEDERKKLEDTECRLNEEINAERGNKIAIQDQIQSLTLFNQLIEFNEDKPGRIKALLPRFIDYVVWHTKENGEGYIEVALFPRPIVKKGDDMFKEVLVEFVDKAQNKVKNGKSGRKGRGPDVRCFAQEYQLG